MGGTWLTKWKFSRVALSLGHIDNSRLRDWPANGTTPQRYQFCKRKHEIPQNEKRKKTKIKITKNTYKKKKKKRRMSSNQTEKWKNKKTMGKRKNYLHTTNICKSMKWSHKRFILTKIENKKQIPLYSVLKKKKKQSLHQVKIVNFRF